MAQDKINMPMSGGGLVRYFDDYRSKIEFKPGHIIILAIVIILIEIILYNFGKGWFGLP